MRYILERDRKSHACGDFVEHWRCVKSAAHRCTLLFLLGLLSGCDSLAFYSQAVRGQMEIVANQVSVDRLLEQSELDSTLREQLKLSQSIVNYAQDQLGLEVNGRYRSYVDLKREYVVWNVFAAMPYELQGKRWCYPIVGCAPYRGYFSEQVARATAAELSHQGYETYVGPVPAYSTLGWFKDPILSSFIHWPAPDLASLLIHELAHGEVWVKDDVVFNENYANFVGRKGAQAWYEQLQTQVGGVHPGWTKFINSQTQWYNFQHLLVQAKEFLHQGYQLQADSAELAAQKLKRYDLIRGCYRHYRKRLGEGRFDPTMAQFNNAYLVSIGTYADWSLAFEQLFSQAGSDWDVFYASVRKIADMPHTERQSFLQTLTEQQEGQRRNDHNAHEINCQPFFGHGLNGETTG